MSDLERLNEALANEGVVWRVLDGDHDDYIQAHDAFAVFAELVEEYRDLLANGQPIWWCEEHESSSSDGDWCGVAALGDVIHTEFNGPKPTDCRIVPMLLTPTTEEET